MADSGDPPPSSYPLNGQAGLVSLVALLLLTAGCTSPRDRDGPPTNDARNDTDDEVRNETDDEPRRPPHPPMEELRVCPPETRCELAPRWAAGDSWNYTIAFVNGTVYGNVSVRVLHETWVGERPAYAVRWWQNEYIRGEDRWFRLNRTQLHETDSLNQAWDTCSDYAEPFCRGQVEEYWFPLWDGKEWQDSACEQHLCMEAFWFLVSLNESQDHATWDLVGRQPANLSNIRDVRTYDPEIGLFANVTIYHEGRPTARWILDSYSFAAGAPSE